MDLSVASRVQQHPIVRGVTAAMRSPHLVMAVPPCEGGNRCAAVRTTPILTSPKMQQGSTSFEGIRPFASKSLFKIEFPLRVVGIGLAFELGVSFDGETRGTKQVNPTFKGEWYAAVNFALLLLFDTRLDQCPQPHRRSDEALGCRGPGGWQHYP